MNAAGPYTPPRAGVKPYPLDKCVVSNEAFEHGKPYTFVHQGQEVKLCCKDCLADFNKVVNPGLIAPIKDLRTWTFIFRFLSIGLTARVRDLAQAGTNKSSLLSANLWIKDMALFADMNSVWNAWVDPENPPARACVRADLARPEVLVEIMVTAAK